MPEPHNFEHLPLLRRYQGPANIHGGGNRAPQTIANRQAYHEHASALRESATSLSAKWRVIQNERRGRNLPIIPEGVPVLLKVDPSLDLDLLRSRFAFEIVAEQEEGYVIVGSRDIELGQFVAMVNAFSVQIHGSATVASVHTLFDDPTQTERLRRILSERLFSEWPTIDDILQYIVDIGISCTGTQEIPSPPKRGRTDTDAQWALKQSDWARDRAEAYTSWDEIKSSREGDVARFVSFYNADVLSLIDGSAYNAAVLPDSFTTRLRITGQGLKDIVLNYPYIFEVIEPDDIIILPQRIGAVGNPPPPTATPMPPLADAPAVCIIDSGIQEEHLLLQPAIDHTASHCFLPGMASNNIADEVRPAGHGTRVAGAVLYGEEVPKSGEPQLPFWIQNARVLNRDNRMPVELFPPAAIRAVIERYYHGPKHTRLFNHSINSSGFCRGRYMSSWAAEIDATCYSYNVLVVQSAGNLQVSGVNPHLGIKDHVEAGRDYPHYLYELSCRVANPGQSLQALTVGSVAYGAHQLEDWKSFAQETGHPSAFTRSGYGIWNVIKPEVVEWGGDAIRTNTSDIQIGGRIPETCPELVRSTMFPPGPAFDRDQAGTSFAAPKVTRTAALLQLALPSESALLYRALIVQSAKWPDWAEAKLTELRQTNLNIQRREVLIEETSKLIRCLGYGIPDEVRATSNSDFRTTFITHGETNIKARECHLYQVPIPPELRNPADEFDIRIDVTLSYVAQPRRTRRNLRRYLSTWVDWKSNKLGERMSDFRKRAMKDAEDDGQIVPSSVLPWTLHEKSNFGLIRNTKRGDGTVQKDWAIVKSNSLPDPFCIAVIGHPGWSHDPDSTARYTMVVTFEILGQEIPIYEPLRSAVIALQSEVESEVEIELETEVETED
jgi:hypothetical protein